MNRILFCTKDAINTTFPLKKVSQKDAKKLLNPWMTKEILTIIKKRDELKKEWILSGHIENTPEHIAYKSLRNCVVRMSRDARKKDSHNDCIRTHFFNM